MKGNFDALLGLAGICIGFIGVGYAFGARKKLNDISDMLDKSIDELSDNVSVDIPDCMIDRAVEHAVNRETEIAVKKATDRVISDIETRIKMDVASAVSDERTKIQESVKKEIEKKVSRIDIDDLRREVVAEAKEAAAEKLDGSLDDILEKFNDELHSVSKIYSSIAKAITRDRDTDSLLRLT